jgi:hypothetical protein
MMKQREYIPLLIFSLEAVTAKQLEVSFSCKMIIKRESTSSTKLKTDATKSAVKDINSE